VTECTRVCVYDVIASLCAGLQTLTTRFSRSCGELADFGFASSFNSVQNVMYTECGTPGQIDAGHSNMHGCSQPVLSRPS
jgi:hypothetical protein